MFAERTIDSQYISIQQCCDLVPNAHGLLQQCIFGDIHCGCWKNYWQISSWYKYYSSVAIFFLVWWLRSRFVAAPYVWWHSLWLLTTIDNRYQYSSVTILIFILSLCSSFVAAVYICGDIHRGCWKLIDESSIYKYSSGAIFFFTLPLLSSFVAVVYIWRHSSWLLKNYWQISIWQCCDIVRHFTFAFIVCCSSAYVVAERTIDTSPVYINIAVMQWASSFYHCFHRLLQQLDLDHSDGGYHHGLWAKQVTFCPYMGIHHQYRQYNTSTDNTIPVHKGEYNVLDV